LITRPSAFVAFTVVQVLGFSWQTALGAIFLGGLLFVALTLTGMRSLVASAIPRSLKFSFAVGIGLFLAFIGLNEMGLVAVGVFAFMDGWNEFLFSLTFISDAEMMPLTVGLFRFISRFQIEWHHLMAGSLLATIVAVGLFMTVQDKLTRGMLAISEK
jgi:xanthine/uracil/vitamin C permease (AzgA family)